MSLLAFVFVASNVAAAFIPNNLIDDSVFNDSGSMSASQIDSFLNGFASSCLSTNNGFSSQDVTGYNPSQGFLYGGAVSAGTVIDHAAKAYDLSPRVILATLQKEQSLVTGEAGCHPEYQGDAPQFYSWSRHEACSGVSTPYSDCGSVTCGGGTSYSDCSYACKYNGGCVQVAVGYDCPGFCKKSSAGFSKQVIKASWSLKFSQQRSLGNYNWNIQKPGWDNSDDPATSYSGPMTQGTLKRCSSCTATYYDGYTTIDGQSVHMDTGGTVALYRYTPFFSGNQRFVTIYEGWFGSVQAPSYGWQLTGQYAYTDQTKATPIGLNNLAPGQRVYIGFTAKNTGNQTWTNSGANPVNVGTLRPLARGSSFADATWLGPNRPASMKEATVAPGQTGTFEFWITAPTIQQQSNINFNEYFGLVREGIAWFPDIGMYYGISVQPARYSWQLTSQYAYTDQTKSTPTGLGGMSPGQRILVGITAKNTGNQTWTNSGANPVFLATSNALNRPSSFARNAGWQNINRAAIMQEASVAPGQTATFEFWMVAPMSLGGSFREYFNLVSEGKAWMDDLGLNFSGSLINPSYSWGLNYQYAYTDQTKTTPTGLGNLAPGQSALVGISVKNTGSAVWYQGGNFPINLGTSRPTGRNSLFYTAGWPGYSRPSHMLESSVAPGQNATFEFLITAPATKTTYLEFFNPVVENFMWMQDIGLNFNIRVN